ncbi:hypothetical protein [Dialister invisus]|uniref:hypothetical protein n=1 Tax=Dialister invisus TaxID=218538 RepID=UPI0039929C4F
MNQNENAPLWGVFCCVNFEKELGKRDGWSDGVPILSSSRLWRDSSFADALDDWRKPEIS